MEGDMDGWRCNDTQEEQEEEGRETEKLTQSCRERTSCIGCWTYSTKKLTHNALWENHVLENFLVYDPSPKLQLHTQMHRLNPAHMSTRVLFVNALIET